MLGSPSILVVEDERSMREFLEILLRRQRYAVTAVNDGAEALAVLEEREFDAVITDLKMPKIGGLEILKHTKERHPATEVVMITAFATTETAIQAMKVGAYDYLTKPFKVDEILITLERALERRNLVRDNASLRSQLSHRYRLEEDLIGRSPAMQRVFELVRKVAPTRTSVLISGESGTGKELVARAVHALSGRREHKFVAVNCGAIPDTLMESELFGHVRGAFTGATADKQGLFSAADEGTLFLDEIAELSQQTQVKLLRALQERLVKPVGGVEEVPIDVRVLAASNRDLDEEVRSGRFRPDLFYRLNVIPIHLPPLRERRGDIPVLARHFIEKYTAEQGRTVRAITPAAMALLCGYHYPGNVRELENLVERAVTLTSPGEEIDASALPELSRPLTPPQGTLSLPASGIDLDSHVGEIEKQFLLQALKRSGGNRTEAARMLGISLRSMRYRLAKFGIDARDVVESDENRS